MKFKEILISCKEKEKVIAYESWIVRWTSRYGCYSCETKPECEIFPLEEDADRFANQLREAFKLIRHTHGNDVIIERNKQCSK